MEKDYDRFKKRLTKREKCMFNLKKFLTALMCGVFVTNTLSLSAFCASAAIGDSRTYVYDDYTVTYNVTNAWGDTEVVSISISNTGTDTIEDWMLYFDPNDEIQYANGVSYVATTSGVSYFKNPSNYNANIAPNGTVTFTYAVNNCTNIPDVYTFVQSRQNMESGDSVNLNVTQI